MAMVAPPCLLPLAYATVWWTPGWAPCSKCILGASQLRCSPDPTGSYVLWWLDERRYACSGADTRTSGLMADVRRRPHWQEEWATQSWTKRLMQRLGRCSTCTREGHLQVLGAAADRRSTPFSSPASCVTVRRTSEHCLSFPTAHDTVCLCLHGPCSEKGEASSADEGTPPKGAGQGVGEPLQVGLGYTTREYCDCQTLASLGR